MQRSELIKFRDVVNCKSFRNFSLWQAPCVPTAEDWNLDSQSADLGVESQIRGVQLDVAGSGWDWPQRGIPWNYIHIFDLGWVLPVLPGILLDMSCEVHCGISCGNILHFFAIILFDLVLGMNFVYIIYIYIIIYIYVRDTFWHSISHFVQHSPWNQFWPSIWHKFPPSFLMMCILTFYTWISWGKHTYIFISKPFLSSQGPTYFV
jgi:hypothetical protein